MRTYSIGELAEAAQVTTRTIRFYTAEGLLPPPDTRGRYARYTEDHLNRLTVIQQMKEVFLPLHAIRDRLDSMETEALASEIGPGPDGEDDDVLNLCAALPPPAARAASSASDYIRRVMKGVGTTVRESPAVARAVAPAPVPAQSMKAHVESKPAETPETWERIQLTQELELHARLPRSPETQRLIDRLMETVRLNP